MIFLCSSVGNAASFSEISELAVEVGYIQDITQQRIRIYFQGVAMEMNVSNFGNLKPHSRLLKYFGVKSTICARSLASALWLS